MHIPLYTDFKCLEDKTKFNQMRLNFGQKHFVFEKLFDRNLVFEKLIKRR